MIASRNINYFDLTVIIDSIFANYSKEVPKEWWWNVIFG